MGYTNSQIKALIEEHVHSARDRCLLLDRLINGMTYERLAEKYDMSDRQIRRIVSKHSEVIFDYTGKCP